jgi:hypothetical protein
MLLVPIRFWIVPRLGFSEEELNILDGPVASPFVSDPIGQAVRQDADPSP